MARKAATYIVLRGKMYQYHRRIPQAVITNANAWRRLFGGQRIYRASLETDDYAQALERGAATQRKFNELVRQALQPTALVTIQQARASLQRPIWVLFLAKSVTTSFGTGGRT